MQYKPLFYITFFLLILQFSLFSQDIEGVKQYGNKNGIVYDFCFSKKGEVIYVAEENYINAYNTETQELKNSFLSGYKKSIISIDISPDNSMLVSGGKDSIITIWDIKTTKIIKKLDYHNGVVTDVKFSPKNNILASGSSDNTVILYDLSCDTVIYKFKDHSADVTSIDFNSDGSVLVSAGEDKIIIFRSTTSGELINTITEHRGFIRDIRFNEDDSRFISCDDKSKVFLWKTNKLNKITKLSEVKVGKKWILSTCFTETGTSYAYGGIDGKIRIKTSFNENTINVKKVIHKLHFKPGSGQIIIIAVATRGRGVLLINTSKISNGKI